MAFESKVVTIECRGAILHGILDSPDVFSTRAVLIVVGGPQYRVGSHRQFALLSRYLADHGVPTMRFDHRGIGDSDGDVSFEQLDPDIEAAVDTLCEELPNVREIVLWGLCDAAAAAMMYAPADTRIRGLILLNPWFRDDQSLAQTYLKRYYLSQVISQNFWQRLISGQLDVGASLRSLLENVWLAARPARLSVSSHSDSDPRSLGVPFQKRMEQGLHEFQGNVLFIMSGDDLTAAEFKQQISKNRIWQKILRRDSVCWKEIPESNHTFSRRAWRQQVEAWSRQWISSW